MQGNTLREKLELACRIAKSYFDRGMGSGTTGNLSFMHDGIVFITAGGSCFGFLTPDDFAAVPCMNTDLSCLISAWSPEEQTVFENALQKKPSKELTLHRMAYDRLQKDGISGGAVIHTHATWSVLWSCLPNLDPQDCVPDYTPYLKMKMGSCGLIPYEKPGSPALFEAFARGVNGKYGWLLSHHGLVTCGKDLMEAFGRSEELEESCKVAWMLRKAGL